MRRLGLCPIRPRRTVSVEKHSSILERYTEALADFDRAIELDPKQAKPFALRGQVYANRQDYGRAVEDYNQAVRLDPGQALIYAQRGASPVPSRKLRSLGARL